MIAKVIKVIPGEYYKVGDNVRFDQQKFEQLRSEGYLKAIGNEDNQGPEIAVIQPRKRKK